MKKQYKRKNKKNNTVLVVISSILIGIVITSFGLGFSALLDNDVEVEPNSELKYYLNISYDGVDKNGVHSDDTTVAEIKSGILFVEDKIPEGLEFQGFVTTDNGTIGAVKRSDGSSCVGKVIDDTNEESETEGTWNENNTEYTYHGLHYSTVTNKVSFQIKNLKAGCELTVGIITKTPATVDDPDTEVVEKRRDFYNFATAWEKDLIMKSNTVHAYMGKEDPNMHKVTYQYEGDIPDKAPLLPDEMSYSEGSTVGVAPNIQLEGYVFNGWILDACKWTGWYDSGKPVFSSTGGDIEQINDACKTWEVSDIKCRAHMYPDKTLEEVGQVVTCNTEVGFVCKNKDQVANPNAFIPSPYCINYEINVQCCGPTVLDKSFEMPDHDVIIKGSFTKIDPYKVTYQLEGITPPGYVLPSEKEYYPNAIVNLDLLKAGDVFNGYRFLGWETEDVEISNDRDFTMPEKDVVLKGQFEEVTYKVSYEFFDTVLPPNHTNYLPETKAYKPGTNVTLEDVKGEPSGYKFLGWYKENTFEMPNQDVVIYGEWKVQNGTFAPTITKTVIGTNEYYQPGETVEFKITVRNTASYTIKDVIVKENTNKAIFTTGSNYSVLTDHIASIDSIPAGGTVNLYAMYIVTSEDEGIITNEVEIKGALADNHYELEDKEYKATTSFKIKAPIKICKNVDGTYKENNFQFHVTGTTNGYDTWISLKAGECKTVYVEPSSYKVLEVVPQEYKIKSVTGSITSNNGTINVVSGQKYSITYTNEFVKKNFFHSYGRIVNEINQEGNKVS